MATTYPIHPATTADVARSEHHVVHNVQVTLKYLFGLLPIAAGADKFTNLLANWEAYLNPMILRMIPVTPHQFMMVVGIVEIVAGVLVFIKPRLGAFVVMAWLLAISAQLIVWGQYLDIAVRDIAMALGGALTLARLTPFALGKTDQSKA
ncbi:MAG: tRNA (5-methylaminomethyl-2-thiouridylate)-methyltransferase [Opitutaceae bacterium]